MSIPWFREFAALGRPARSLLISGLVNNLGIGLTLPIGVLFATHIIGVDLATATSTVAITSVGAMAGHPLIGLISDRWSPTLAAVCALTASSLGSFGYSGATSFGEVAMWALVSGLGLGATTAWLALLTRYSHDSQRQFVFGANQLGVNVGVGVGLAASSVMVAGASEATFRWLYVVKGLCYAVVIVRLLLSTRALRSQGEHTTAQRAEGDSPTNDGPSSAHSDGRASRPWLLQFAVLTIAIFLLYAFGYVQIESGVIAGVIASPQLPSWVIGLLMLANTVAVVLLNLVVLPRLPAIRGTVLAAGVALVWMVAAGLWGLLMTLTPTVLIIIVSCLGATVFALGEVMYAASFPAITSSLVPPAFLARCFAVQNLAISLGFVCGPLVAGPLVTRLGPASAMWVLGGALAVPAVGLLLLAVREKRRNDNHSASTTSLSVGEIR